MLRHSKPLKWKPKGVCDAVDGTNAFPGAMTSLANLVLSPTTGSQFVPRPAAQQVTTFPGFTTPGAISVMKLIGTRVYGLIASGRNAGNDEPFVYDVASNTFVTVANITAANTPTSPASTGDWTPPVMDAVGSRIYVTHPGFSGIGQNFFGFFDISGFTSNSITGNTHTSTTIDNLASNVLQAGWQVGMKITSSGGDIPDNTFITAIASNGLSITISNAATGSNVGDTFTVTGGTFAAPLWNSANTNGNPLPAVPVSVTNFNNRAYFAVKNTVVFSDSLNGSQVTNATQAITLGDTTNVTALGSLPLSSSTQGGIIQSIIAFKGDAIMWQIQGDQATNNLTVNALNVSVGTLAPNTICATPFGLAFMAPDGLRIIDFNARVSDPIGADGAGVSFPFLTAVNSSRMCAAFNQNTLRISVQNGQAPGQPWQEWFLDFTKKVWTGPHTSAAQLIEAYQAPTGILTGHGFVTALQGTTAKLFTSNVTPTPNDSYVENGTTLSWSFQTCLLPDNSEMTANAVVESAIGLSIPVGQNITCLAQDEIGNTLNSVIISGPSGSIPLWGSFTWGAALWGTPTGPYREYRIPWTKALVFKQMSVILTGISQSGAVVGNLYLRYQPMRSLLALSPSAA